MLFFSWLYGVEHDKFKPRIPTGATQEDLIRISRFYDLAPENPKSRYGRGVNSFTNSRHSKKHIR